MATVNEIATGAQYVGNAALGGGNDGVISINTKPLEDLAVYSMMYRKAQWEEKRKQQDTQIKDLADLSDIKVNDLKGKDRDQMVKEIDDLFKSANEYARKTPKNFNERVQNEIEWQKKYGAFKNNYGSGKARAIAYTVQEKGILEDSNLNAQQKELKLNDLKKRFESTGIETPLSSMNEFKPEKIDIPNPTTKEFDSIAIDKNEDVVTTNKIWNPVANAGLATASAMGIKRVYKKGTKEYESLSDLEKQQQDQQELSPSETKIWTDMAEPINSVLKNYVVDGQFDANKFEQDNASNTILMNAYNSLKSLSKYHTEKKEQIQTGLFSDRGLSIKLPPNVNADDYNVGIINFANGVKPDQLALAAMFSKYPGDKFEKKLTQTDNEIQIKLKKMDEAGANYRARLAASSKGSGENKDKPLETVNAPTELLISHIERAKSFFKKNGNKNFSVPYKEIDDKTKTALNIKEDQYVIYRPDGSYIISTDRQGDDKNATVSVGTIDNLVQGFIDAVKVIDLDKTKDKDGTMAEGFQMKSENKLKQVFGTTSGKDIWNSWGKEQQTEKNQSASNLKSSYKIGKKVYTKEQLNELGYSDEQILEAVKLGNIK